MMLLLGLILRFVFMPLLTYDFDIYHWALVIENINSGNDLYGLSGYYYTPIWGYILGAISAFNNAFLNLSVLGETFTNMLPIEALEYRFHIATITTIQFNILIKTPLIICDVIVGYIIYHLIRERTGDSKKAAYGFGLWFLCPIVIYMSAIQAMFDTISALLLLLTVLMLLKDRCFLAGFLFVTVFLLKFFPAFCILVLISYIFVRHRDDGLAKRKFTEALMGALIALFVLMLPQIVNGQVCDTLSFIVGRASNSTIGSLAFTMSGVAVAMAGMIFFGYRMLKSESENSEKALFGNVFFSMACASLISMTPQYVIVMIPFMVLYIVMIDGTYRKCWYVISIGAVAGAFILNNFSLFCSISEYTSLVSPGWLISCMQALEGTFMGITYVGFICSVFNAIEYIGILMILIFRFSDYIKDKCPRIGSVILRLKGMGAKGNEI